MMLRDSSASASPLMKQRFHARHLMIDSTKCALSLPGSARILAKIIRGA
jgi:hypothetical protein